MFAYHMSNFSQLIFQSLLFQLKGLHLFLHVFQIISYAISHHVIYKRCVMKHIKSWNVFFRVLNVFLFLNFFLESRNGCARMGSNHSLNVCECIGKRSILVDFLRVLSFVSNLSAIRNDHELIGLSTWKWRHWIGWQNQWISGDDWFH